MTPANTPIKAEHDKDAVASEAAEIQQVVERDPEALIPIADVKAMTGLSVSNIYARIARQEFPEARKLGPKAVRWKRGEIMQWIDKLPRAILRAQPPKSKRAG